MADSVLAAVRVAPSTTELRELPMPELSDDAALLKVEVAGICGTDVKMYAKPPFDDPVIMGHENVGTIAVAGKKFKQLHGVAEGDRVFVEHYVGCYNCEWCRIGEYRHCEATDWRTNADARRYGYTSSENPGTLWGGFSEYMYLPWNAVLHKVPDGVTAELAGLVTPLSNGIEWALLAAGVGYADTVLIEGPGQQGLSQVVACKQAGASKIIVSGTTRDKARLDLALDLGADEVIDIEQANPYETVMDLTARPGRRLRARLHVACRRRTGAAGHRRAQAPRGHAADPGRAGGLPRLPDQAAHREGDHDQERPRPQLPGLRAGAGTAGFRPVSAGAAVHAPVRPRSGGPCDPRTGR